MSWSEETVEAPPNVEPLWDEHQTNEPSVPGLSFIQWFIDRATGFKYKRLRDRKAPNARVVWKRWRD